MMKKNNNQPESPLPLVYLVVLNWNAFDDTHECLLSLQKVTYANFRTIVVENGSTDNSPQQIKEHHPEIKLLISEENKGIAAGYNKGIQAALQAVADHIVVMNNDLVFCT